MPFVQVAAQPKRRLPRQTMHDALFNNVQNIGERATRLSDLPTARTIAATSALPQSGGLCAQAMFSRSDIYSLARVTLTESVLPSSLVCR